MVLAENAEESLQSRSSDDRPNLRERLLRIALIITCLACAICCAYLMVYGRSEIAKIGSLLSAALSGVLVSRLFGCKCIWKIAGAVRRCNGGNLFISDCLLRNVRALGITVVRKNKLCAVSRVHRCIVFRINRRRRWIHLRDSDTASGEHAFRAELKFEKSSRSRGFITDE